MNNLSYTNKTMTANVTFSTKIKMSKYFHIYIKNNLLICFEIEYTKNKHKEIASISYNFPRRI